MLVMLPDRTFRRREIAIELLLLLGRKDAADLVEKLAEQVLTLTARVPVQLLHLEPRAVHHLDNLMVLGGSQIELAIHPLDQAAARHSEYPMTIREGGERKTDEQAGRHREREAGPFEPIGQSRSSPRECRC